MAIFMCLGEQLIQFLVQLGHPVSHIESKAKTNRQQRNNISSSIPKRQIRLLQIYFGNKRNAAKYN